MGNKAGEKGGAIYCDGSEIILHGNTYFETNTASYGGAIYMERNSQLILAPINIKVSFIMNYAENKGGAIYFKDSQCSFIGSTHPTECFLSIFSYDSSNYYATRVVLLHFLNNSADFGSTLYGGQLNKCRIQYRNNYIADTCGNRVCNDYSDYALEFF